MTESHDVDERVALARVAARDAERARIVEWLHAHSDLSGLIWAHGADDDDCPIRVAADAIERGMHHVAAGCPVCGVANCPHFDEDDQ
jgi:hypothetical protein